jgi:hypothetical protein
VSLDDNIINGQLQLAANNPVANVAASNRIRGGVTGDQAAAAARAGARSATADRPTTGDDKAAARTSAAKTEAVAAGPAKL